LDFGIKILDNGGCSKTVRVSAQSICFGTGSMALHFFGCLAILHTPFGWDMTLTLVFDSGTVCLRNTVPKMSL
jgi:hypothetical protein